jgi:tetraacyldisaccharide 4'-kinase
MMARDLLRGGCKPAIVSRGYGARGLARGEGPQGNDEFHVLRSNLPEVPHFQGRDRYTTGLRALAAGANVIVLDDGFQHVKLHRDLDLVLVDAIQPFGYGRVLPAGLLREPLGVLSRAELFAVTRCDKVDARKLSTLAAYLRNRFPGKPVIYVDTKPVEWVALSGEKELPPSLGGRRVLAFCGIGNPEAFRRQLLELDLKLEGLVCFRDHHRYTDSDIGALHSRARELGVEEVVMTQKDAVKIESSQLTARWKFLRVECRIVRGQDAYDAALQRMLEAAKKHAG